MPHFDWRDDLRPGNLRNTANQHPLAAGIVIGGVLLAIVLYFYLPARPPGVIVRQAVHAYYVDEETGQETVQAANLVPPLSGPSGKPTVVRAVCFSSDGGKTKVTGYYETYTPEAKGLLEGSSSAVSLYAGLQIDKGHLVRKPNSGSPWVWINSDQGKRVCARPVGADGTSLQPFSPP